MKAFLFILIISFGSALQAETEYTLLERLALLLPGNEQKLIDYKTELYNEKYIEAKQLMTSAYLAFLDYDDTNNILYLNRALILADQFNSNLRFLTHNQQFGNKEELITLATVARYEFYYEFEHFINRSWARKSFDLFDLANLETIFYDFNNVYFNDLDQPRDFN